VGVEPKSTLQSVVAVRTVEQVAYRMDLIADVCCFQSSGLEVEEWQKQVSKTEIGTVGATSEESHTQNEVATLRVPFSIQRCKLPWTD
jgi:hypothetical protein